MTDTTIDAHVYARREGAITRITLNRPRALNALTRDMVIAVRAAIELAQTDGSTAVLLDGAGERGFCGGGDVKQMVAGGQPGAQAFLQDEYRTDFAIHAATIPVVGYMDGITMGGGIGLTGHATVRIVTERSRLAMPETRIGIVPDVGGNVLLAAAPGRVGDLLAAASGSLTAGDALALGFADHYLPSSRFAELRVRLSAGEDPAAAAAALAEPAPKAPLLATREWLDPIADAALGDSQQTLADPVAAAQRLVAALAAAEAPATQLAAALRAVCPTAAVVALAQIARVRAEGLDVAGVLADDYRVLSRMTGRADFAEGARAQLIEKDGNPRWTPATFAQVDPAEIARILDPAPAAGEQTLEL